MGGFPTEHFPHRYRRLTASLDHSRAVEYEALNKRPEVRRLQKAQPQ
jgi:hypothetical protein